MLESLGCGVFRSRMWKVRALLNATSAVREHSRNHGRMASLGRFRRDVVSGLCSVIESWVSIALGPVTGCSEEGTLSFTQAAVSGAAVSRAHRRNRKGAWGFGGSQSSEQRRT